MQLTPSLSTPPSPRCSDYRSLTLPPRCPSTPTYLTSLRTLEPPALLLPAMCFSFPLSLESPFQVPRHRLLSPRSAVEVAPRQGFALLASTPLSPSSYSPNELPSSLPPETPCTLPGFPVARASPGSLKILFPSQRFFLDPCPRLLVFCVTSPPYPPPFHSLLSSLS